MNANATTPAPNDHGATGPGVSTLPPRVLFRKDETARWMNVSVRTLEGWMAAKRIPYIRAGGTVLFNLQHVAKALERFTIQTISDE